MVTRANLMKQLEEKFQLGLGTTEDFYDNKDEAGGIWIRTGLDSKLTDYFDYDLGMENNVLTKFVKSKGWFIEAYDSETMMIYKGGR